MVRNCLSVALGGFCAVVREVLLVSVCAASFLVVLDAECIADDVFAECPVSVLDPRDIKRRRVDVMFVVRVVG